MTDKILTPINLGAARLKNRLMFLAMAKELSNSDGTVSDREIAYFANIAKNNVALIATGAYVIDPEYDFANQPGLYDDRFIPGLKKLVDEVHAQGDTKILAQLWHPGKACHTLPPEQVKGPTELSVEEIHLLQGKYATGAYRAKQAGFDGIEFHIAHNYLPEQFLMPMFNQRTDEYSCEPVSNGMRFSLETIAKIRELCGEEFLIVVKINGEDYTPDGITIEKAIEACLL